LKITNPNGETIIDEKPFVSLHRPIKKERNYYPVWKIYIETEESWPSGEYIVKMHVKDGYSIKQAWYTTSFFMERCISAETAGEWNNKGFDLGKAGEYEKAIECFDKAIELNPNAALAYNNRGNAYKDLGQYERAI
jgi:tetratricopeptide (TPR) repeat protein